MNNKRAVMITAIIIVMLSLSIVAIYCGYSYYRERMAQKYEIPPSPYTIEDIQNSDAAYLLDPNLVITEDNVQSVLDDYFSAPARLSFTIYASEKFTDSVNKEYKCDNLEVNAAFAKIFTDKTFSKTNTPAHSLIDKSSYLFENDTGFITISCFEGNTYIEFSEFTFNEYNKSLYTEYNFVTEGNYTKEIEAAIESALPYSMEVLNMS